MLHNHKVTGSVWKWKIILDLFQRWHLETRSKPPCGSLGRLTRKHWKLVRKKCSSHTQFHLAWHWISQSFSLRFQTLLKRLTSWQKQYLMMQLLNWIHRMKSLTKAAPWCCSDLRNISLCGPGKTRESKKMLARERTNFYHASWSVQCHSVPCTYIPLCN